jgi:hypothetical protein
MNKATRTLFITPTDCERGCARTEDGCEYFIHPDSYERCQTGRQPGHYQYPTVTAQQTTIISSFVSPISAMILPLEATIPPSFGSWMRTLP